MEIELGHGKYRIEGCEREGRIGLVIRPIEGQHKVNEVIEHDKTPFIPGEDGIVIWVDNIEAARVLQNQVNVVALRMNRYEVANASQAGKEEGEMNKCPNDLLAFDPSCSECCKERTLADGKNLEKT